MVDAGQLVIMKGVVTLSKVRQAHTVGARCPDRASSTGCATAWTRREQTNFS